MPITASCDAAHWEDVRRATGCVVSRPLFGFGPRCLQLGFCTQTDDGELLCVFMVHDVTGTDSSLGFADLDGIEFRESGAPQ